jgi:GTP-binding protein Era
MTPGMRYPPGMSTHSGTVALVGRPNAGKSTLLNTLVGARIAAVSRRPQTTRTRLVGAWTREGFQAVLVDTPGIHVARSPLNTFMVREAEQALEDVDAACWIIDAETLAGHLARGGAVLDGDLGLVRERLGELPVVVALNKVDLVDKPALLPVMQAVQDAIAPHAIVPISATRAEGMDGLARSLAGVLPEQDFLLPEDHVTDALERQIAAELIREQVFEYTSQEVPYATAVEIERFDESARAEGRVHIHAKIVCEKASQKAILIGAGGAMIKRIGTSARRRIRELVDCQVRLDLFVVVEPDWTTRPKALRGFGYAG